ncbi:hypothetical protein SUGI_0433190 [Cryptomeria japonica]|nr:hypothetical protein SUGI_0433190 [Cryptomeria japonica]
MAAAAATSTPTSSLIQPISAKRVGLAASHQSQHVTLQSSSRVSQLNGLRICLKRQVAANRTWKTRSFGSPAFTIFAVTALPETLATVQDVIAKQLSIEVETVQPATKFADLGADSLDTVEIMMALEEKFEISIGEGGAENIATVQDAADLIEKVKSEGA